MQPHTMFATVAAADSPFRHFAAHTPRTFRTVHLTLSHVLSHHGLGVKAAAPTNSDAYPPSALPLSGELPYKRLNEKDGLRHAERT